jgi:hypothetical protein
MEIPCFTALEEKYNHAILGSLVGSRSVDSISASIGYEMTAVIATSGASRLREADGGAANLEGERD